MVSKANSSHYLFLGRTDNIKVTSTGEKTALAGLMRLVAQAQSSRSRAQALADRAAFPLTIVAVVAAVVTLVGWFFAGREAAFLIERAFERPRSREDLASEHDTFDASELKVYRSAAFQPM